MPEPMPLTIVNVGYLSTNYWVVSVGRNRLLGGPGVPGHDGDHAGTAQANGHPA